MCRTVVENGTCPRFCPYRYDFENRLVGLTKGTGSTGNGTYNYTYDYRTRRIVRDESSAGGALTDLVFSGGTSVQEYTGSTTPANLQVEYIRGSDYGGGVGGILYSIRSGTPSYTHENKRGDIIAKTSSTGALTYQAQYEAFGNQTQTAGSTLDRQKSNSKDTDPTGLVDEGFRYRDLETGGFITRDPAGFVDGPNLYTYVVQNPWTHFDPEGLWVGADDAIASGGGAVIGVAIQGAIDLYHGHLSSYKDYVASGVGGAAAGEAALYTGGIGSGAAYGAASNLTKQGLNNLDGTQHGLNVNSLAADTAVGAVGGKIGEVVAPVAIAGAKQVANKVAPGVAQALSHGAKALTKLSLLAKEHQQLRELDSG